MCSALRLLPTAFLHVFLRKKQHSIPPTVLCTFFFAALVGIRIFWSSPWGLLPFGAKGGGIRHAREELDRSTLFLKRLIRGALKGSGNEKVSR